MDAAGRHNDLATINPSGILGPLLHNASVRFVKGFYRRPLKVGGKMQAGGGGLGVRPDDPAEQVQQHA